MRRTLGIVIALQVALQFAASTQAALIAHYTFDADGAAAVGTDASLGSAASIDNTDFAKGGGSLKLSGAPAPDTSGSDGAVSGNTFDWSASDTRTVAFWMKADAGDFGDTNATMISLGSGSGAGNRFDLRIASNLLRLEVQNGGMTSTSVVADGQWHHIAVVVTDPAKVNSNIEYYLDGVSQGPFGGTSETAIATGTGPLRMGDSYQDNARDFKGHLDDVRLYNTALSATEIASLVPEPSSLLLVGGALAAIGLPRRKK